MVNENNTFWKNWAAKFSAAPKAVKIILSIFIAALIALTLIFGETSCSVVRANLTGNGKLSTSVHQSVADSVSISVHFNNKQ